MATKQTTGYDLPAMRAAVEACDKNIAIFRRAIEKEIQTKLEYEMIVQTLEAQAAIPKKLTLVV